MIFLCIWHFIKTLDETSPRSKVVQSSQHAKSNPSSAVSKSLNSNKASSHKAELKPPSPQAKTNPRNSANKSSSSQHSSSQGGPPKNSHNSHTASKPGNKQGEHSSHAEHANPLNEQHKEKDAPSSSDPFAPIPETHHKCRKPPVYARAPNQPRVEVPDEYVQWKVPFPSDYSPPYYTDEHLLGDKRPPYADADIKPEVPSPGGFLFNELDGKIDRRSHMGPYKIVDNMPQ